MQNSFLSRYAVILIVVVFAVLAVGGGITRAPWCDEAYFAEPALQIIQIGRMATIVDPPSPIDDPRTVGTDRFVFWTLPLDIVLQAGWYKALGFGMVQMRLLATLWAFVAMAAWWMILKSMGAGIHLRLIALALIAFDYSFIRSGSEGRMDMMSAALGFLGIAFFLRLQERNYMRAIFAGSVCAAASVLTHPIGGLLATAGLGLTILWYSRGRLRWWHPALAAIPYLFFGACWGVYILQAPDLFQKQLLSISGNRLNAWTRPFDAVVREFSLRWGGVFGLSGSGGFRRLRALVLVTYAAGLIAALVRWQKLRQSGFALLLVIALMNLVLLCLADNTKSASYLVHIVPWLAALSAIFLAEYWRTLGATVFATVIAVQVLGTAYIISQRQYQREYLPAVRFVQEHGGRVTGDAQLGFGLGFTTAHLIDDHRFGFYSHAKPALVAMDASYAGFVEQYRSVNPAIYAFIQEKLARSKLVFSNSLYQIYLDPDPR
jgi:hypothetical protein